MSTKHADAEISTNIRSLTKILHLMETGVLVVVEAENWSKLAY